MQLEIILAFIGLLLSIYAYRITMHIKRVPSYKPICDISKRVSCTRAFLAKESHLLFVPNSAWGMIYYFLIIIFVEYGWTTWAFYLSTLALIVSLYLAYVLYYKQNNFCVVCWATHLVNLFLFIILLFNVFL